MAQGFQQQQIECTPFALIRSLSSDLVQDEGGEGARREQVPIAPQPRQRVAPVGFAAYGRPILFYVVNCQHLIGKHNLCSGQAAQSKHPFRILMLQLAALKRLRQHERAPDKEGRSLDISFAAGKRAARQNVFANLFIAGGHAPWPHIVFSRRTRDHPAGPDDDGCGRRRYCVELSLELARKPFVVVIQKRDPFALSSIDTPVTRVRSSNAVRQRNHMEPRVLLRGPIHGQFGARILTVDNHDHLDRAQSLGQRTPHCPLQ
jgi:hypothetical protein